MAEPRPHLEKTETDAIHAYVIKRAHDPEYMPTSVKPVSATH